MYRTYNGAENLFYNVHKIRWVLLNRTVNKARNRKFLILSVFVTIRFYLYAIHVNVSYTPYIVYREKLLIIFNQSRSRFEPGGLLLSRSFMYQCKITCSLA